MACSTESSEAALPQVCEHQAWLLYGAALHRLREWGTPTKVPSGNESLKPLLQRSAIIILCLSALHVSVDTGGTSAEVSGRAVVVHAYDGSRVACATLKTVASAPMPTTPLSYHYVVYDNPSLLPAECAGLQAGTNVAVPDSCCFGPSAPTPSVSR